MTLKAGRIAEMGEYDALVKADGEFAQLIRDHVALEQQPDTETDEDDVISQSPLLARRNQGATAAQSQGGVASSKGSAGPPKQLSEEEKRAKGRLTTIEDRVTGSVSTSTYGKYCSAGGAFLAVLLGLFFLLTQGTRVAGGTTQEKKSFKSFVFRFLAFAPC